MFTLQRVESTGSGPSASTRTSGSFFVWPVLFNAGTWLHEVLRGPFYRLVDTFAVFDGVWARSDSSHVGSEHLLKMVTSAFIHAARACVKVRTARELSRKSSQYLSFSNSALKFTKRVLAQQEIAFAGRAGAHWSRGAVFRPSRVPTLARDRNPDFQRAVSALLRAEALHFVPRRAERTQPSPPRTRPTRSSKTSNV